MANSKISQLPEAALPVADNDLLPIVQTNNSVLTTRRVSLSALNFYSKNGGQISGDAGVNREVSAGYDIAANNRVRAQLFRADDRSAATGREHMGFHIGSESARYGFFQDRAFKIPFNFSEVIKLDTNILHIGNGFVNSIEVKSSAHNGVSQFNVNIDPDNSGSQLDIQKTDETVVNIQNVDRVSIDPRQETMFHHSGLGHIKLFSSNYTGRFKAYYKGNEIATVDQLKRVQEATVNQLDSGQISTEEHKTGMKDLYGNDIWEKTISFDVPEREGGTTLYFTIPITGATAQPRYFKVVREKSMILCRSNSSDNMMMTSPESIWDEEDTYYSDVYIRRGLRSSNNSLHLRLIITTVEGSGNFRLLIEKGSHVTIQYTKA